MRDELILSKDRRRNNSLRAANFVKGPTQVQFFTIQGDSDRGKGHFNFAPGAGAPSVMRFCCCIYNYLHINFRNGAGTLYLCYVLHYATVGHVHTNFPMGPISFFVRRGEGHSILLRPATIPESTCERGEESAASASHTHVPRGAGESSSCIAAATAGCGARGEGEARVSGEAASAREADGESLDGALHVRCYMARASLAGAASMG